MTGWNGKHCTQEGCPNSCSGHGQCRVNGDSLWECRCSDGWDGPDCSVLLEQNCADGRDNDKGQHYEALFIIGTFYCINIVCYTSSEFVLSMLMAY